MDNNNLKTCTFYTSKVNRYGKDGWKLDQAHIINLSKYLRLPNKSSLNEAPRKWLAEATRVSECLGGLCVGKEALKHFIPVIFATATLSRDMVVASILPQKQFQHHTHYIYFYFYQLTILLYVQLLFYYNYTTSTDDHSPKLREYCLGTIKPQYVSRDLRRWHLQAHKITVQTTYGNELFTVLQPPINT